MKELSREFLMGFVVGLARSHIHGGAVAIGAVGRWNALGKVSTNRLLWQVWRPLRSFYPNCDFTKDPLEHY
jgi:hypothetical protein